MSHTQPFRIGVVGVGHIGKSHARVYSELAKASSVLQFSAIYDTQIDAAKEIANQYQTLTCDSLEAFAEQIDAASIATPTSSHFEVAQFLLERGKHLLIEKPITENTAEAWKLSELASQKNCVLQIGHIERYNPALGALEALLTRPRFIEAHRLSPYPNRSTDIGVVLDLMIHDIEVILHLVRGAKVVSIDAVGVPVLSRGEDIANARIRFADGCVANITASRISPEKMRKIRVFQEDAYLSLDYQNQSGEIYRKLNHSIVRESVMIERDEPLRRELIDFVQCAQVGTQPRVGGAQAAAALELAIEITRRLTPVG